MDSLNTPPTSPEILAKKVKVPMTQARLDQLAVARVSAAAKRKQRAVDKKAADLADAAERLLASRAAAAAAVPPPRDISPTPKAKRTRRAKVVKPRPPTPPPSEYDTEEEDEVAYREYERQVAEAEAQEAAQRGAQEQLQRNAPVYGQMHEHLSRPAF